MKAARSGRPTGGFTLIELVMVLAVIAILALMAVPSYRDKMVREQVVEGTRLADVAKAPIAAAWGAGDDLPADNAEAGLPAPERIVGNLVSAVTVEDGAIHVTFGHQASSALRGKTLSLRAGVMEDERRVPVAWVCGKAAPPGAMQARGRDRTDLPAAFLPANCRASTP